MADQKLSALTSAPSVDRTADLLYIVKSVGLVSYSITPNSLLGITGAPIGDTDVQTLSGKTLTNPTINGATLSGTLTGTYTLGGTPTFPSSVLTTTNVATVTNKTLTSPTINTATIVNPTITVDAISGFSVANTGTIYGLAITLGAISGASITANTVPNTALQAGIQSSKLANPYKFSVYYNGTAALSGSGKVPFNVKDFDTGNNFDAVTNFRFVAPVSGFYYFETHTSYNTTTATRVIVSFYKNGVEIVRAPDGTKTVDYGSSTTWFVQLSANDYVEVFTNIIAGTATYGNSPLRLNAFAGYLVSLT
jgi:hypothetical protein